MQYPNIKIYAGEKTFLGLADDDLNMSYLYEDEEYTVCLSAE